MLYQFTTNSDIFNCKKPIYKMLKEIFIKGIPEEVIGYQSISEGELLNINKEREEKGFICLADNYENRGNKQHEFVQNNFIEQDDYLLGIEVPVWSHKLKIFGHIDILRLVDNKIQILDFKPKAHQEKKAPSQVFRYGVCIAEMIGCSIKDLEMYYFDDKNCFKILL